VAFVILDVGRDECLAPLQHS